MLVKSSQMRVRFFTDKNFEEKTHCIIQKFLNFHSTMNALLHCLKHHNDAKIKTTEIEKASDTLCQIGMNTDGLEALSEADGTDGLNS